MENNEWTRPDPVSPRESQSDPRIIDGQRMLPETFCGKEDPLEGFGRF